MNRPPIAAILLAAGESTRMGRLKQLLPWDGTTLIAWQVGQLREAGAVLGVHEATASRRLTRVHAEVRRRVEAILVKEHGWTQGDTARSLSEAAAHLDSDLELMLTTETAAAEKRTPHKE